MIKLLAHLQRGEIHLHSESTPGYFSVVAPTMVKDGTVIPLYYDAYYDGTRFSVPEVMKGSSVPPFQEFYRKLKGRDPSGPLWDAYRTNLAVDSAMLRTIAMPPGAPPAAQAALRAAIARLNNDKDYAVDTMKAMPSGELVSIGSSRPNASVARRSCSWKR